MNQTIKQKQIGEFVRRHFSSLLMEIGKNIYGHDALVTVTNVIMSADLGIAKIYLSVYNVEGKQEIVEKLDFESLRLKKQFAKRIRNHMRRIPNLHFYLDDTLDTMYHLNGVFDRLHAANQMGTEEE